jgi:23S rRNA pseudoU1915 N3-methylase RlmH
VTQHNGALGDLMHMPHLSVILIVVHNSRAFIPPIRAAEGLPDELKTPPPGIKPPILLVLSSLTFTHQFARLVLIEADICASETRKGSGYHK